MSTYPNNSYPYGPYQGRDPYAASSTPLTGAPYPGYEDQDAAYPTDQPPNPYQPQPGMVTRPMQPVYDPLMAQVQQMAAMSDRTRSNAFGSWALGLSVVSVFCCTYGVAQLVAFGLGVTGIAEANKGHANNKSMSIAAIIIAAVSVILWGAILGFFLYSDKKGY